MQYVSPPQDSVLPEFHGDDLKRLRNEIEKLRMFQKQAKGFRFVRMGVEYKVGRQYFYSIVNNKHDVKKTLESHRNIYTCILIKES